MPLPHLLLPPASPITAPILYALIHIYTFAGACRAGLALTVVLQRLYLSAFDLPRAHSAGQANARHRLSASVRHSPLSISRYNTAGLLVLNAAYSISPLPHQRCAFRTFTALRFAHTRSYTLTHQTRFASNGSVTRRLRAHGAYVYLLYSVQ